jgi:catechol 2,3-dioxygenase-like lactoylglutathione lyase family enzyme
MNTSLSRLGQIALTVPDVEAAIAFYRDRLGIPFLFAAPPKLAFFDVGGVRLMLSEPEGGETLNNSTLYFAVTDIHSTHADLQGRGIPFDEAPHVVARMGSIELWMAFFRDPGGNLLAIMCELPIEPVAG